MKLKLQQSTSQMCASLRGKTDRQNRILNPHEKAVRKALNNWQLYLMLLPAVIYILLFKYRPMYGLQIAFRNFWERVGRLCEFCTIVQVVLVSGHG